MSKQLYFRCITKRNGIKKDERLITEEEYKAIRSGIRLSFISREEYEKWLNKFDKAYKENKMVIGYYIPLPDGSLPYSF